MPKPIIDHAKASWGRRLWRLGLLLLLLDVLLGSVIVGFQTRRWAWDYTMPIRHHYDINRNFDFGRQCITEGYLNIYENMYERNWQTGEFSLNYPPLRLMTFYAWATWADWKFPGVAQWREDHAFNAFRRCP